MAWTIKFTGQARKQLTKLDSTEARRIRDYLRQRLAPSEDPRERGKPLRGHLGELWRYRVGDYRIVCELWDEALIVLVVRLGHRKEVYK